MSVVEQLGWLVRHGASISGPGRQCIGATTYTGLKAYWPAVGDDPQRSPAVAANPEVAEIHRETAMRNNEIQKVVVSDSLTPDETARWTSTTTIVPMANARDAVRRLKDQPGKDILVFGSRTLWNGLLAAGLVDELYLMIGATVLGGGTPTFGVQPVPALRLADTRRRDASDNVLLCYDVVQGRCSLSATWRSPVASTCCSAEHVWTLCADSTEHSPVQVRSLQQALS